jgi:hypothetical protein
MDSKNIKYIVLTILLLILSVFGVIFIFKINSSPLSVFSSAPKTEVATGPSFKTEPQEVENPEVNTADLEESTKELSPTSKPTSKPTIAPIQRSTPVPTRVSTPIPTKMPTPQPTSSIPTILTFTNPANNFSIKYLSNRKVYSSTEEFGDRYTFYNNLGNFAVHVTRTGTWCWTNSGRTFTSDLTIAGLNTYRYDISSQTIVDIQAGSRNYTLQCVHNGRKALKVECEEFIKSFTFLKPDPAQSSPTDSPTDSQSDSQSDSGSEFTSDLE